MNAFALILAIASLSVTASPARHNSHSVTVIVRFEYVMQCGQPGPGPIVLTFPKAEGVPTAMPANSVLLNGKPTHVRISGRRVAVSTPPLPPIMCDAMGPSTARIAFTSRAGLRNPLHAGRYAVTGTHGTTLARTTLTIS